MPPSDTSYLPRSRSDEYVRLHEVDENAHGAERHRQNQDWAARELGQDASIAELERRLNAHDIAHASSGGELRGIKIALGWGFGLVTTLLLAFGGTALYLLAQQHP